MRPRRVRRGNDRAGVVILGTGACFNEAPACPPGKFGFTPPFSLTDELLQ